MREIEISNGRLVGYVQTWYYDGEWEGLEVNDKKR